ncbi:CapA family protein [Streptomyces sp. NBC_01498]|uniref:CapA family protein n=1 Tax=Streptomyces sp. NBC_01498 TaxID=2975870 RepID=UPI002E7AAF93|nr:CapA family protein [Streptomyces sp. NBC_01498]WTL23524.1 CapA family protein [Streptomyces sp. NBC_01498]
MTTRMRHGAMAAAALLLGTAAGCAPPSGTDPARDGPGGRAGGASAAGGTGPGRGFTLVASGDVLPHDSVIRRANADAGGTGHDFVPMLAGVKSVVSAADVAICHMETVYGPDGGPFTGYPSFASPPQIAGALRATGYDSCSTASNHTLDAGADGVARTLGALDRAGVAHVGSARSAAEDARPALLDAGGAKVAQLAYTYDTNGIPLPDGQPWAVDLIDEEKILTDARAARAAGADVVVLSLHWGTEWQSAVDDGQLTLGDRLAGATTDGRPDIDLIIGTHVHVPQAYEKVNGTWIVYGMGDQIAGDMINHAGESDPRGTQGSIARFTFAPPAAKGERWEVTRAEFVPQLMDNAVGRVVNLNRALDEDPSRDDYRAARSAIESAVLSRGAARDGLTTGR